MRVYILLLLGLLGFFSLFEYSFSHPQSTSAALLAQLPDHNDLITPVSPTPVWPFTQQIVSEEEPKASPAAQPEQDSDYCLDVPIIMYHHIQPLQQAQLLGHEQLTVDSDVFEKQMAYLVEDGYTALSAEDLTYALINHEQLPEKPIIITIDDGYIDNYSYAFLMAKKYNLIMNFMISTELIGKPDYMTWDHLKEMSQSPVARIYNHTATHAPVGLHSKAEIADELNKSTQHFKSNLDLDVHIFAYPYGSFSTVAVEMLEKHGFAAAFTTVPGRRQCESQRMLLNRDHIGNAPLTEYGL